MATRSHRSATQTRQEAEAREQTHRTTLDTLALRPEKSTADRQVTQKRRRCEKTLLTDRALVGTVHCRCSTHGLCLAPGGTEPSLATKDASLRAVRASNAPDNLNLCGDGRGAKMCRWTGASLRTFPMASHIDLHI